MESMQIVWEFLVKGGITMIPLGLCSLIGLAVVVEKMFSLREKKIIVPEIVSVVENIEAEDELTLAQSICEKNEGPFSNILLSVLRNRSLPAAELKELVEETGRQQIRILERGLVALETVAGIAPLLGLLGTVIGILKVFNVISEVGIGQAAALSVGISEALITTIVGLSIGIPAVVFFNYFTDKAENIVLDIEKYSSELIARIRTFELKQVDGRDAA